MTLAELKREVEEAVRRKADSRLTVILGAMLDVTALQTMNAPDAVGRASRLIETWLPGCIEVLGIDELRRQMTWLG